MNCFTVSVAIGIILVVVFFAAVLLNYLIYLWFKWVGDGEEAFRVDWYFRFVMTKILNFKESAGFWKYRDEDGNGSDGEIALVLTIFTCFSSPIVIYICYLQPLIPIVLATFIAVSFALRGVKRLIKELKEHKQDKNAHN